MRIGRTQMRCLAVCSNAHSGANWREGEIQGSAKRLSPGWVNAAGIARQADVVSSSRNKIHQTWGPPFSREL